MSFLNTKHINAQVVKTETLSMSTGLKDTNGQMIYDGDILDFRGNKVLVHWNSESFQWDTVLLVEDKLERAIWRNIENHDLGWVAAEVPILGQMTTKIIGNRWDNPELLYEVFEKEKDFTTISF